MGRVSVLARSIYELAQLGYTDCMEWLMVRQLYYCYYYYTATAATAATTTTTSVVILLLLILLIVLLLLLLPLLLLPLLLLLLICVGESIITTHIPPSTPTSRVSTTRTRWHTTA